MARDRDDDRDDDRSPRRRDDRDDRPRRRDDDRGDDRPRRSYRRDDDDTPPRKEPSVLGIFGLIAACVAAVMSFIPCLGVFAFIPAGIALLKSIIAMILASVSQGRVGKGIPLAGIIVSGGAILMAIIQVVVLGAFAATRPTTPAPSTDVAAEVSVTAEELDTAYDDNVALADAKYKGKTLDVTGVVERVADDVKKFRLTVELTGNFSTVDCDFGTSDRSILSTLKTGSTVTIRGKCIGRRTIDGEKYVTLEKCVLVQPGGGTKTTATGSSGTTNTKPSETKPSETKATGTKPTGPKPADGGTMLSAAELEKAYEDDEDAADAKYKDKVLTVTGGVYIKLVEGEEFWFIYLGQKHIQVKCRFKPKDAGVTAAALSSQVTIRGKCTGANSGTPILTDCTLVK